MVLEIRTYRLKPGTSGRFEELMGTTAVQLLTDFGIRVVACGLAAVPDEHPEPDGYLMRAFASLAERDEQEAAFYGSDPWLHGPRDAILALIESWHTVVLELPADAVQALGDGLAPGRRRPGPA